MIEGAKFQAGDMIWHPKTKLVGKFVMGNLDESTITIPDDLPYAGTVIPSGHALVVVSNVLSLDSDQYIWSLSSIEKLDNVEYKLVAELNRCRKLKTELNKQVKEAQAAYGAADAAMLEYLDRMAIQGTRQYAGIGQVTIDGQELHPSITEEDKEKAFEQIEAMGRGEIIKRQIHHSTLEAFVNELDSTGVPIPDKIKVFRRPKFSFAKKK